MPHPARTTKRAIMGGASPATGIYSRARWAIRPQSRQKRPGLATDRAVDKSCSGKAIGASGGRAIALRALSLVGNSACRDTSMGCFAMTFLAFLARCIEPHFVCIALGGSVRDHLRHWFDIVLTVRMASPVTRSTPEWQGAGGTFRALKSTYTLGQKVPTDPPTFGRDMIRRSFARAEVLRAAIAGNTLSGKERWPPTRRSPRDVPGRNLCLSQALC
jgi:hypothetical protein